MDNHWKCSKLYPQIKDEKDNFNNIIDNTNELSIEESNKLLEKKKQNKIAKNNSYGKYIPQKQEFKTELSFTPIYYYNTNTLGNYSNQDKMEHINFLGKRHEQYPNNCNSFKPVSKSPHINL